MVFNGRHMKIVYYILFGILILLKSTGDGIRHLFHIIFSTLSKTYNSININKITSQQTTVKRRKNQKPRSLFRRNGSGIPGKWLSRLSGFRRSTDRFFRSNARFIGSSLRIVIRIPSRTVSRVALRHIISGYKNRLRLFFSLKPTPVKPYIIYPLPLKIAWQIQSFFLGVVFTILFIVFPVTAFFWIENLPNPHLLSGRDIAVSSKIYDRNGLLLYEIYADENRTPVPLSKIPDSLLHATIAIEDKDFFRHPGFSPSGIIRAARETVINHRIQGGSTLTQQLIKSALLTPEISLERKIKELLLAMWAERIYSKNQILEMYLNQVPYGGQAWGVEAASRMYFGKSVQDISLAESALLAGLPAAPTEYSPFGLHPEKAVEREREVLRRMVEDGYITYEQAETAKNQKITYAPQANLIKAPHFVMYIRDILEKRYGTRRVGSGGLIVRTSLDYGIQEKTEQIVRTQIDALAGLKVGNGAAVVTNPRTGEILSMIGSRDYFDLDRDGNVNVAVNLRQPGSSIKVVTYSSALENGFTAASILDDSPVAYRIPGSPTYIPVNYDGRYHGPVPFRYALANSYNIPAVKVLARIGLKSMIDKGRAMGIRSWNDESRYGLSLTLGAGEVTMLDMARVYGTLANQGRMVDTHPILEVRDYAGNTLEKMPASPGIQAVTTDAAWIMSNILSDNVARTPAFGPNSSLVIPGHTVSVKTGTSNEKRDNWTIGYTPSYVVTVWVGNNDNSPMDPVLTSGITGASPIWHDIMLELLRNKPDEKIEKPSTIVEVPCYNNRIEYFIRGTEPHGGQCLSPTLTSASQ